MGLVWEIFFELFFLKTKRTVHKQWRWKMKEQEVMDYVEELKKYGEFEKALQ